jgi:hypothetical protein
MEVKLLKSECLECRKIYNKQNDGKKTIDITHGICPQCFKKIKDFRKAEREHKQKEDKGKKR